jgi:citrate lyase subunit beta/citryl-CoA lyase
MKNSRWGNPVRTAVFVPGYLDRFLLKAKTFDADALILDLEDAVPHAYKADARVNIRRYLDAGAFKQPVFVRVNAMDTGLLTMDMEATLTPNTSGFMFTKVRDERDIIYLDRMLAQYEHDGGFTVGQFKMFPLIEMGSAVMRAYQIAMASERVIGLAFGAEDYLTDLDGLHKDHGTSLVVPRSLIVIAARSAGIDAVDTPYLAVHDASGFRKEVEQARELGFSGQLILHPSQIAIANDVFTPSAEEIAEANRVIAAIEESRKAGQEVALLDGQLIGPPMMKRAQMLLEKATRMSRSATE